MSDWYPWLQQTLLRDRLRPFDEVLIGAMPAPDEPVIQDWVAAIAGLAGADPAQLARTVFIGHSVGCQAILRLLATLPPEQTVAGVLCVAGWWDVDRPWPSIRPWMDMPPGLERVRRATARIRVLVSDNDPYTSDYRANQRLWIERLDADVRVIAGARHFNGSVEPAVLAALAEFLG